MRQYKSNHVSRSVEEQDGLLAAEYDERKREKKKREGGFYILPTALKVLVSSAKSLISA